jgi:hypothetical protein
MGDINTLNKIDNPNGRIKFKDIKKIDIGFCKNDLVKQKKKTKSAFYNCFVLIYRVSIQNKFKEIHIKMFNTGKIEIPGIQNEEMVRYIQQQYPKTWSSMMTDTYKYSHKNTPEVNNTILKNLICIIIASEKLINYYKRYGFDIEPESPVKHSYIGGIPMFTTLDKIAEYCAPSVKMDGGKRKKRY